MNNLRRWGHSLLPALILLLSACSLPLPPVQVATPTSPAPSVTPSRTPTVTPTPLPTATPTPTATSTPRPTYTPTPQPSPTAAPVLDPQLNADSVSLFPWPLYMGDTLSLDVDPLVPSSFDAADAEGMTVTVTLQTGETFTAPVAFTGLDQGLQARFYWVDQVPLAARTMGLTVTLNVPDDVPDADKANNVTVLRVPLLSARTLPPPEPAATWAVTETTGFRLHYLTGSAAERDLAQILVTAEAAYADVTQILGAEAEEQVDIYLLDRVVGQGGYASSEWVAVTYTDRRYMPVELGSVLRHELVHRLDGAIGCDEAPSAFREGLAVYLTGGHYRQEPLREKAGALLATTYYMPLEDVVSDFYTHQHEAAYLEAAALLEYVVERFGWDALGTMCAAASDAHGSEAQAWDAAAAALDVADLQTLEREWQAWLRAAPATEAQAASRARLLDLELRLMDAMRRYQAEYDEPAHFIEGLLFSPAEGARNGIVADFVRRPREPEAVAMELLLAMGQEAVDDNNPALLAVLLEQVDVALTAGPEASQLAGDLLAITRGALDRGYEPYRVVLEGDDRYLVYMLDRDHWPAQVQATARRAGAGAEQAWELSAVRTAETAH